MLRRICEEIISGKNIDLYLGILISLLVALLGIFDMVDLRVITATILLILSLIAIREF